MKNAFGLLFLAMGLFAGSSLQAQTTVKMSAVKANNYGVTYSLPKTLFTIETTVKKTTRTAGEFYQYAERYLGVTNAIKENSIEYSLQKVNVQSKGIPDKSNSYLVEFRSNTQSPFVTLTKDGLICAINNDAVIEPEKTPELEVAVAPQPLPNPRSFLSEEIMSAGSTAKQAELIAKQIFKLRETRNDILTGDADNMPPDGNAYKLVIGQLTQQEKILTEMFVGHEESENFTNEMTVIPTDKNMDNQILFRFSKRLGIVAADDLAGAPVYLSLVNKTPVEKPILTDKEAKALAEKMSKGIIYNIPSKALLELTFEGQSLLKKEVDVVQFGTQDVLTEKMFDNNKQPIRVIFYPDLGAVKQIIQ